MTKIVAALVLVGVVALAGVGAWLTLMPSGSGGEAVAKEQPPLAAVMYLWYGFDQSGDSVGGLGSSHWNTPGPNSGHRRGVTDEPAYGFYSSDDQRVIRKQLADMQGAGINVILISWWGWGDSDLDPSTGNENQESVAVVRAALNLLGVIQKDSLPLKVAFLVEPYMGLDVAPTIDDTQKQAILDQLWDTFYDDYSDLMFQWDGNPLVVTWHPVELDVRDERFTVKTWGTLENPSWRTANSYLDWNWYPDLDLLETMISDDGMYVVFPRYDEYWLWLGGLDRDHEDYPRRVDPLLVEGAYERAWQVAVENQDRIKLVVVNSWNEHKEHTGIEPDQSVSHLSYGRSLLEKTARYYRLFLAGQPIPPPAGSWSRPDELKQFIGNLSASELGLATESVDLFLMNRLTESQSLVESHIGRSYSHPDVPPAVKNIQLRLAANIYNFVLMNKRNPVMQVGEFNFGLNDNSVFTDALKADLTPFRKHRGMEVLYP